MQQLRKCCPGSAMNILWGYVSAHGSSVDLKIGFIVKGEVVLCEYTVTEVVDFVDFFALNGDGDCLESISVYGMLT